MTTTTTGIPMTTNRIGTSGWPGSFLSRLDCLGTVRNLGSSLYQVRSDAYLATSLNSEDKRPHWPICPYRSRHTSEWVSSPAHALDLAQRHAWQVAETLEGRVDSSDRRLRRP